MENTKMIKNVCRRFVLHNDFLPPTCRQHDWPFFAFGYYDGFSVGKNLFADNEEQKFTQLWADSVKERNTLDEKAMSQVVYGFRDEDRVDRDQMFWDNSEEGEKYPFIFFVMIQFEKQGREKLSDLYYQKAQVEDTYTEADNYKSILYLTLENSDVLFVVRSKSYEAGARLIDQFHRKKPFYQKASVIWKVKYSFTVASIDKQYLKNPDKMLNNQGRIDHVYVYTTERSGGSVDAFFEELKKMLPQSVGRKKESVLGYNDELIILSDITWDELLMLYKIETGLLNHTNEIYQKYLSGLTSIIALNQDNTEAENRMEDRKLKIANDGEIGGDSFEGREEDRNPQFSDFAKRNIRKLDGINRTHRSLHQNMMQSLYNLVNSFSRFDQSPIRENLFFPASFSICQLILMLQEMLREDNPYTNKLLCYGDYQRFLSGLNLYAQNWVRSDRQFTQSLDFNIKIYNLPVILNAFYNAFIYYVRECLNEPGNAGTQHIYEFLTCPGAAPDMVVDELFIGQSEQTRFFLISIPENQTYNLELMLIMLCHEVAHFVGAHIRNRPVRCDFLNMAFCRMVTIYYRYRLGDMGDSLTNDYWKEFEKKLVADMSQGMEKCYTRKYLKKRFSSMAGQSNDEYEEEISKILKRREVMRYHSKSVKEDLLDSMIGIIRENRTQYFTARENAEYFDTYSTTLNREEAEKSRIKIKKQIDLCSMELIQLRPGAANAVNLDNMLACLMSLFKECLSDVIGIMLLQLTCPQYLEALMQNIKDQGKPEILAGEYINETLIRIGLVCGTMIQTKTGEYAGYSWDGAELDIESADSAVNELSKNVKQFIYRFFMCEEQMQRNNEQVEVVTNYLLDGKLLKYIKRYLFNCRVILTESLKNKGDSKNKVAEMFRLIKSESISEIMLGLHTFVDEYRNEIYARMDQLNQDMVCEEGNE